MPRFAHMIIGVGEVVSEIDAILERDDNFQVRKFDFAKFRVTELRDHRN
jgi:hypothetical protein